MNGMSMPNARVTAQMPRPIDSQSGNDNDSANARRLGVRTTARPSANLSSTPASLCVSFPGSRCSSL